MVFDDDDWRSVIENGIFTEDKHPWHLTHFPQKTEEAVVVHCVFALTVMALCTTFRLWAPAGPPEPEPAAETQRPVRRPAPPVPLETTLLGGEGAERWRRRLRAENRGKVIVFVGRHEGIFTVAVFALRHPGPLCPQPLILISKLQRSFLNPCARARRVLSLTCSRSRFQRGTVNQHPTAAQRYVDGMVVALRTRDPLVFAEFLLKSGRGSPEFAKDPRKLEQAMHRFILTFPELADLHEQSRQWLTDHPELIV